MKTCLWLSFILVMNGLLVKTLRMDRFAMCDSGNYPIHINSTIHNMKDQQYLSLFAIVKKPMGLNQYLTIDIEFSKTGNNFARIFRIKRPVCDFFNKDISSFWFELQRQIGVTPRTCPMPVGRYSLTNYEMPYYKLPMVLPTGLMKTLFRIFENGTNKTMTCININHTIG